MEPLNNLEHNHLHPLCFKALGEQGLLAISREGKVLSANPIAEVLLSHRLSPGLSLGNDCALAKELLRLNSPLAGTLKHGEPGHGVLAGEDLPGGKVIYCSIPLFKGYDRIIGSIIIILEVQDDKNAQELKFLGLSHKNIMDNLAEGVFVVNTRWQITCFNQTAKMVTGYLPSEVPGKFCWEVFQSNRCKKNCPLRLTMTTGEQQTDQELIITTKNGSKKTILANTSLLKGKNNMIIGGIQSFRDISRSLTPFAEESERYTFSDIVGNSPRMQEIFRMLPQIAASDSHVLIQGESGTGKDLIAKAIHFGSQRRDGPFVAVNFSALTETLLESELFGHERGAFTGAISTKIGRFDLAKGGTIFLDEIAEVKPEIQVKLLRILEDKFFERVGGTVRIPMDARIVAATNRNLAEAIKEGKFREDLYFRLSTVPIFLPPLRERRKDIPLLVNHLIKKFNKKSGKRVRGVDPKLIKWFCGYKWPGNVRELEHVLEYCFVFVKGPIITDQHLPPREDGSRYGKEFQWDETCRSPLLEGEKYVIVRALEMAGNNRSEAARILKISRGSLWRKMKRHGVE